MSGIRKSGRLVSVKGKCGHKVDAYIPPGELGPVGRRNIERATQMSCPECKVVEGEG